MHFLNGDYHYNKYFGYIGYIFENVWLEVFIGFMFDIVWFEVLIGYTSEPKCPFRKKQKRTLIHTRRSTSTEGYTSEDGTRNPRNSA